jgi:hypothetical protein
MRHVIRLKSTGMSTREIARRVGTAPSTVRLTIRRFEAAGLSWPLSDDITDTELEARLFASAETGPGTRRGHRRQVEPDWAAVHRELRRKHVTLAIPVVAGDAGAAMEHLDGGFGGSHLDNLADHAGWHRVEVSLNFDMVIRRHTGTTPFGVLIGFGRQRHQGRKIDGVEELAAAGTELAHQAGIEFVDQDADRNVQLGE